MKGIVCSHQIADMFMKVRQLALVWGPGTVRRTLEFRFRSSQFQPFIFSSISKKYMSLRSSSRGTIYNIYLFFFELGILPFDFLLPQNRIILCLLHYFSLFLNQHRDCVVFFIVSLIAPSLVLHTEVLVIIINFIPVPP